MSTARRQLGMGPSTPTTRSTTPEQVRLLPVERADPGALLEDVEQQDVGPKGRRTLGPGASQER